MEVRDVRGELIEVGDTVVYGVYTRGGALQVAKVEAFVPYDKAWSEPNPFYNDSLPATPGYDGTNSRYRRTLKTEYKVRFRQPDRHWTDRDGIDRVEKGRVQTLDRPQRFAVVAKAVDTE